MVDARLQSDSAPRGTNRHRIVVLGYLVRGPIGGMAWHHSQYVLGLHRLGHKVMFIEDSEDYPSCYDPDRGVVDADPTYGLNFATRTFERIGLGEDWAYYDAHTHRWLGAGSNRALSFCRNAEVVLNLSGVNPLREWLRNVPARVLVDTDPAFTQIHHLTNAARRDRAAQHTAFFSFGENIGGSSLVPDDGFPWQATRQPIVLDAWPVTPPRTDTFTTVMQWDSYKALEHGGRRYGMKSESFEPYLDLPARTGARFEIALGSESAPRSRLQRAGWSLRDPLRVTRDPWRYQAYIQESKAEFSVAKHGYVVTRSGWFSERSACYLASGRPVIVQETGFSDVLPVGTGLLAFSDIESAAEAVRAVRMDYPEHCLAARRIAEHCFDSDRVLSDLLDRALTGDSPRRGRAGRGHVTASAHPDAMKGGV